jgi:FHA domain
VKDQADPENEYSEPNETNDVDDQPELESQQADMDSEVLRRSATRGLDNPDFEESEPRWGTARFNERTTLMLFVRGAPDPLLFDAGSVVELIIGRLDPDTGESPHVDLEPYGGTDKGVSRRHATVIRRDGSLAIVDSGSHNGTFLNGQRLVAHQPRILRDGDDIRLGFLVLRVKFVKTQITPTDPSPTHPNQHG